MLNIFFFQPTMIRNLLNSNLFCFNIDAGGPEK